MVRFGDLKPGEIFYLHEAYTGGYCYPMIKIDDHIVFQINEKRKNGIKSPDATCIRINATLDSLLEAFN